MENSENIKKSSTSQPLPRVAITCGDPNGIGYEVILKTLAESHPLEVCCPVLYGSSKVANLYIEQLGEVCASVKFNIIASAKDAKAGVVNLVECYDDSFSLEPGKSTPQGGKASLSSLQRAAEDIQKGLIDALVTAPINKANIQSDSFHFSGHTEYLTALFGNGRYSVMMMLSDTLRVALMSNHLPISKVPLAVTEDRMLKKLEMLNRTLCRDFLIRSPRIAVLALNPHAGDDGLLGTEEKDVIIPAITKANEQGILAFGPYPADGFFGACGYLHFDAVFAMYHDQGLIPFKTIDMSGVGFTAGLNIVRTSPDHGTAYDIVGKNQADHTSFSHALYAALDILKARRTSEEISRNPLKITEPERRTPPRPSWAVPPSNEAKEAAAKADSEPEEAPAETGAAEEQSGEE